MANWCMRKIKCYQNDYNCTIIHLSLMELSRVVGPESIVATPGFRPLSDNHGSACIHRVMRPILTPWQDVPAGHQSV